MTKASEAVPTTPRKNGGVLRSPKCTMSKMSKKMSKKMRSVESTPTRQSSRLCIKNV